MLRGLHDTRWPLIFALIGYWGIGLGIGSWLAFARDWAGVGIWTGLASGLGTVAGAHAVALVAPGSPGTRLYVVMMTSLPAVVSVKSRSANFIGRRTQPWLAG